MHSFAQIIGLCLVAIAGAHGAFTLSAHLLAEHRARRAARTFESGSERCHTPPPITVLKPLCGIDAELYRCLRSFCLQRYPVLQLVFGVQRQDDPALQVVRQLRTEFPTLDMAVVVDARLYGSNRKISNVQNMLDAARHDLIVLSDSDVEVDDDYLRKLTAAFDSPSVGLVTCLYRARAVGSWHSDLTALFVNQWFIPQVRLGQLLGSHTFTSGVTIALTRTTLARIGGFAAVTNSLADDYRLGELVRREGMRTVIADVVVDTFILEANLSELCRHQLRWLRTIRSVQARNYAFLGLTFSLPIAVGGTLLAGSSSLLLMLGSLTVALRMILGYLVQTRVHDRRPWLFPISDFLALALWLWSFTGHRVRWRGSIYDVNTDGSVERVG